MNFSSLLPCSFHLCHLPNRAPNLGSRRSSIDILGPFNELERLGDKRVLISPLSLSYMEDPNGTPNLLYSYISRTVT